MYACSLYSDEWAILTHIARLTRYITAKEAADYRHVGYNHLPVQLVAEPTTSLPAFTGTGRIVRGWREQANLGAAFEGTGLKLVVCESTLATVLLLLAHPSMKRPGSAAAAVASRPP